MSRRSVSPLDGDEIMSKTKDTEKTRELTEDELNHVSGGKGDAPVKYMEYKLKEVLISGVTPSL
jgi:bacteriocin-like protein